MAVQREKELNTLCEDQASQIAHLNKKVLELSNFQLLQDIVQCA